MVRHAEPERNGFGARFFLFLTSFLRAITLNLSCFPSFCLLYLFLNTFSSLFFLSIFSLFYRILIVRL